MENTASKTKMMKMVASIATNTKKMAKTMGPPMEVKYSDKAVKRDYISSFSLSGEELPEELETVEYGEEYEMKVKVRISDVGDAWSEDGKGKKPKRVELQIKKILSIDEID